MKTFILLPIIIGASLNLCAKNLKVEFADFQNPVANAGADKTIYLNQTNTVTLDGSASSGDSYQWTEVSTDYMSGATINTPNSKVSTVSGLPQGVFYFRIAVTSGGVTKKDSMMVVVDVTAPPKNSRVFYDFPIHNPDFVMRINLRDDTTEYLGYNEGYNNYYHSRWFKGGVQQGFIERGRLQQATVDSMRGKLYNTVIAGQPWGDNQNLNGSGYCRSQINITDHFAPDTNKTYVIVWKFYFPQPFTLMSTIPDWGRITSLDFHGNDDGSGQLTSMFGRDFFYFMDRIKMPDGSFSEDGREIKMLPTSDLYNKANTVKITFREGSGFSGQKAFVKIEVNGVQKLFRNSGQVGKTPGEDYIKLTGIYDWRNLLVQASDNVSHKRFSIVTEDGTIYEINATPTVDAGYDQTISTNATTLLGTANDEGVSGNGVIISYKWTKISGSTATIVSPNSATTNITGLTPGTYLFQLKATDNSGIYGLDTVQINVTGLVNTSPTAYAGPDTTITLPSSSVILSGSGKDDDGTISSYKWNKISGPNSGTINNANSASANVTGLTGGTYQFELTVTDNQGASGKDTVQVIVNAAANIPPIANAGNDQTITLPTNSVTLSGSGTATDGSISSYKWNKISGPNSGTINNANSASANVTGL
ncbi:MAG: hypothetical protein ABI366_01195, partial [Ginsengibacter sp.]